MSEKRQCSRCMFWSEVDMEKECRQSAEAYYGQCRRNAPRGSTHQNHGHWPMTHHTDWCGEYARGAGSHGVEVSDE